MDKTDFLKIIELHKLSTKLKTTLRQGWVKWRVENTRIESIAEHVFGTCMLAVGILSSLKLDLDSNKIISMLMLHETEEIIIGDITPFDKKALSTKKEDGRKAVLSIFKDFPNSQHFLDIIQEFEEGKTKEAKFANQCDKFESDLQSWYYSDNFDLIKEKINKSGLLIITGGNPNILLETLQRYKQIIKHYKGIIIGESAGAVVFLKDYYIMEEISFLKKQEHLQGLGLIDDFYLDVHSLNTENYKNKLKIIKQSFGKDVYLIDDFGLLYYEFSPSTKKQTFSLINNVFKI